MVKTRTIRIGKVPDADADDAAFAHATLAVCYPPLNCKSALEHIMQATRMAVIGAAHVYNPAPIFVSDRADLVTLMARSLVYGVPIVERAPKAIVPKYTWISE